MWHLFVVLIYIFHSICTANDSEHLFMLIGHLYVFPEEMSIQDLCLFLIELFIFILSYESLTYSRYKSFIKYIIFKIFSLFSFI